MVELRVFPCPEDGIFMKAAEFTQLKLKPRWEGGIFPDKYSQNARASSCCSLDQMRTPRLLRETACRYVNL